VLTHASRQPAPWLIFNVSQDMKPVARLLIFICVAALGRAESFVADRHSDGVAEVLQSKIPEFALDRLFEAKRGSAEWHYAFRTKIEKTWVEEVRITVRQKSAASSEVEVGVFRIEGGFVKTTTKPQPLSSADWTAKIRALIAK
jgi:hypothetical protein